MPDFTLLVTAFAAGVGLLLGGVALLLLGRARAGVRVAAAAGACVLAAGGAWAAADSGRAALIAGGAAAAGLVLAGGAAWATSAAAALARRPAVRWGGLAATGVAVALGAVAWHEAAYEAVIDRSEHDLAAVTERPPTRPASAAATTDRGTPVAVLEATDPRARAELAALEERFLEVNHAGDRVIRRQPADDRANCHGWVFTGGRFWVSGSEVETILAENGYRPVADPRPGDLVVYRRDGAVAHTAVVRYVSPGMPVLVEGKWGATGVYLHAADESIYGTAFTYYRADRATHVLAGLDVPPTNAGGQ
jgi:hypothetical protein